MLSYWQKPSLPDFRTSEAALGAVDATAERTHHELPQSPQDEDRASSLQSQRLQACSPAGCLKQDTQELNYRQSCRWFG